MSIAFYDIEIVRGDTFGESWQLIDKFEVPISLYDASLRLQIRSNEGVLIEELNIANGGIVITEASTGKFDVIITSAKTILYNFATCVYDLQMTDRAGVVKTLVAGTVFLLKDVTHD